MPVVSVPSAAAVSEKHCSSCMWLDDCCWMIDGWMDLAFHGAETQQQQQRAAERADTAEQQRGRRALVDRHAIYIGVKNYQFISRR